MKKRILSFVLAIAMAISVCNLPMSVAFADTTDGDAVQVDIVADKTSATIGDVITVSVNVNKAYDSASIKSIQFVVKYDSNVFELLADADGDFISYAGDNCIVEEPTINGKNQGEITFAAARSTAAKKYGEYMKFQLKVKENTTAGTSQIVFADGLYTDNTTNASMLIPDSLVTNTSVTISIPVTGITINGADSITGIGSTAKLTVKAQPANATQPNTDMSNVTWSTSNDKFATVKNGLVTAVGEGKATITATFEGKIATKEITVKKADLTGTVTIKGNAVYGVTLTAAYEEGNAQKVEYVWYREGENMPVGTKNIYTITKDDIGKTLTVWVSDTDNFNGMKKATTAKVEKATKDAPAKPIIEAKENVITVKNVDHDAEYLLVGDGASQNFGKETEFTVQYGKTYYVAARYPETDTHKASAEAESDPVTIVKAPYKLTVTAGEGGTVDGIPEGTVREGDEVTLTANPGDFDHRFVKWEVTGITLTEAEAKATQITFTMGSTDVEIKAVFEEKEAVNMISFNGLSFIYDGEPKTPGIEPTEVQNMTRTVEYFDSTNNKLESAPTGAGTYKVKVTFTSSETSECRTTGANATFTIARADQNAPAKPSLTNATANSFDMAFVDGQEYAMNITGEVPTVWENTITTTGLKPATTYYVFTRVKGNNNYNPSPAVNSAIKTLDTYKWEVEGSAEVSETVRVGGELSTILVANIKNAGTGGLTQIAAVKSGTNADNFTLGSVPATVDRNGMIAVQVNPKNIDNTKEGTYTCTVTVKAKEIEEPLVITFTLKVVEKEVATFTGIDTTTVTFNGETQGIDLSNAKVECNGKTLDASKLTVTYDATETRNAGEYIATIKYEDDNYIGSTTAKLIINKQDVTLTGLTVDNKDYKGDKAAYVHYDKATLKDKIEGTDVNFDMTGIVFEFEDKNVGTNKTVKNTTPITLIGDDAGNYNLTNPIVELTADITRKPVTVTAAVAEKTYNGRTDDANVTISFDGVIDSDEVTYQDAKGTYANADAGDAVKVEVTYIIGGKDAGNYSLNVVKTATGKVNKADLNVTLTAPAAVTYDGNTHGVSGVKDNRVKADEGKTLYTLTYNNNDALPVDAGTYEVTAKLTDEGSKNYNLKANTVDLVINKADMTATDKGYSVAFMLAGAQTRPLSELQLTPANISGKWSVAIKDNTENILDGASIDGENLVFTIKSGLGLGDIGGFAKLDVTFTPDKNYNPVTATVTVTLAQDTYTNSIVGTLPTQVKLGEALDLSGVKLVTKFGSGAPEQQLDVTDAAKVEMTTTYNPAAKEIGVKTVTFTDKANGGITYTHTFTVVDVLEGVKLEANPTAYNYKLKEATTIGFDGKVYAVYKSGAKKALTHADVVLSMSDGTAVDSAKEARLLNTLGTATITLTYTEKYFDGTSAAQSININVSVQAAPAKPDGKPTAEGFIIEPIPGEGKDMKYYDDLGREVPAEDVEGFLAEAVHEPGDTLWSEVKNSGAFSNIDDDNIVYEQIVFVGGNGAPRVRFANGKMQITVPYPADSDKGDEFVMIISDRAGHTETIVPQKTADGLQFEIENSDVTFAIGWYTPAPSPVLPTEPERDPEDNFWNEVYWTLLRSGQGSVITANAGYYDRVPQGVLRAVDISGNTLVINSAFGVQVVVAPGALEKLGMYRIFYPISYLKEMLKGSSVISGSGTTGITVGVLMPTTGDATVVEHPYTMTPATAGIIPGLESAANARPVIDNADGVSVLDGAQRNDGAVIGGGMLIGLGLLALLGAAYVTMRKRGN